MTRIILYTGSGVTFSPVYAEGRVESNYVRLVADDGKAMTDGSIITDCVDVLKTGTASWTEIDAPEPVEPETVEDKAEAYDILIGGVT